jgi:adenine-specific DNA-methyltransferase
MITKEEAYKRVEELVVRFEEQIESYKQADYNETLTRRDFIDPFFKALGWDVDNSQGYAEAYREVIHEDRVKIGKATKAPDYSFRLSGGKRLFFVEAKKPSVSIKDDISVAYQIRRYGWSAKLAVSIITDFEEFAVYDCTKKPKPNEKSSVARIKYINYKDYLAEFDFIWNTFSKEKVLKGSFDKYVQSDTVKKGTTTVDKDFLESLDRWRTYIATSISIRNKELNEDELNYVVQLIIDRLIFLRIAEDRGVESYGQLKSSVNQKGEAYQNLFYNFRKADEKYNSGLFDFTKDVISEKLVIDNKVIKTIVNEMYYPESPYEFSVISVEILGSAYEQFLGKQIKISSGHRAKIEEKIEVRKAGGVYYTPQYVVAYIVSNTLGEIIKGKTPKQIDNIKIVDPACGSGSFLIGAYQFLLDYHKNFYTEKGTNVGKKNCPITPAGELTSAEKKRILTNNIFGVDIDVNAVEVTKLSLLLKCMEGETANSIAQQQKLWDERILPNLENNIKSGNSLVDFDYYESVIDFGEEKKIKPFNWEKAYPVVFKQGGFDVVIGNPPYIKERGNKEIFEPILNSRLGKLYHQGKMDFWYYFVHRGIDILKDNGYLSYITNSYWMKSDGASKLINRLKSEMTFVTIVDFDNYKVFADVSGKHNITILQKGVASKFKASIFRIDKSSPSEDISNYNLELISNETIIDSNLKLSISIQMEPFEVSDIIDNHFEVSQGVVEATDKVTRKQKEQTKKANIQIGDGVFVLNKEEIANLNLSETEKLLLKPYLNSSHVNKYGINFQDEYLLYLGKTEREKIAQGFFPNIKKHLDNMREFITSSNAPYGIHRTREQRFFEEEKLICKGMFLKPQFYYDNEQYYCGFSFSVIINKSNEYDLKLLLGIMNSKLGEYWFNKNGKKRGVGVDIGVKVFRLFPLPNNKTTIFSSISNQIIQSVEQIQQLNKELEKVRVPSEIESIKNKVFFLDNRINDLVYKLYDLNQEQIDEISIAIS